MCVGGRPKTLKGEKDPAVEGDRGGFISASDGEERKIDSK